MMTSARWGPRITHREKIPAREPVPADFPSGLDPRLIRALQRRGIDRLYSHQAGAIAEVLAGRHTVVVTPTASGKTLCYNLPVLDTLLREPAARAIYLFPTKALAQDQTAELHELVGELGVDIQTYTYDGDTPANLRRAIRAAGQIVVTNPDMLHSGIMPHHTKWVKLFENLRYVVVDEMHGYRGVFGSHVANVLRRLRRICRFYGSDPVFIFCSATIANPGELAEKLLEAPVAVVDQNGAPAAEKHILLYNPPLVNRDLGIRQSSLLAARGIASNFLANGIQTIVFARSRLAVEVLLTYLRDDLKKSGRDPELVQGYRGGYLPQQRRAIERGLRSGQILGVVSTNALELGIDIGGLDACLLVGYPGTIASAWQQMGRAGRRAGASVAVLIASSNPLDQFLVSHPDYFFERSPESGLINPGNLNILFNHLKCAAFELPFTDREQFGSAVGVEVTQAMLSLLAEDRFLHQVGGRWHWMTESYPAESVSLRSVHDDNFVIVDQTAGARVIGEIDQESAPTMIHEGAIYLHLGQQYQVERLDYEQRKAYVRSVNVDYYTDASLAIDIKPLDIFESVEEAGRAHHQGEVSVTFLATMYKKIKFATHENVGWGQIHLPEQTLHTAAYWIALGDELAGSLPKEGLQAGLLGLAHLLAGVAPLYLMCDARDIRAFPEVKSPFTQRPTIYLYDRVPGGVGLAERLYRVRDQLLASAREAVERCGCPSGCPSCVGPIGEGAPDAKAQARSLLRGF